MKIIAGFIEPDSGEVEIGQTIKIGYFGQEVDIEPELRVIDYVKEAAEFVRTTDGLVSASAMLERFLFPPEQQYSPVGKLSDCTIFPAPSNAKIRFAILSRKYLSWDTVMTIPS